jgi:hypothetical protein
MHRRSQPIDGRLVVSASSPEVLMGKLARCDRGEELFLVGEVLVRRIVRHARSPADLPQGHGRWATGVEEFGGRADKALTGAVHELNNSRGLTPSTLLRHHG